MFWPDDLRYAQEINGTEDPALRGIKRILISGVRRELLASERIDKALKNHIAMCPGGGVPKTAKEFCLRIAAQYPLVVLIVVTMALQKYGIAWVRDVLLLFRGI